MADLYADTPPPRSPDQLRATGAVEHGPAAYVDTPPPRSPDQIKRTQPPAWDWTRQIISGIELGFGPEIRAAVYTARRKLEGTPNVPTFSQELQLQTQAQDKFEADHPWAKNVEFAASIPTNIAATVLTPEMQVARTAALTGKALQAAGAATKVGNYATRGLEFIGQNAITGAKSNLLDAHMNDQTPLEAMGQGAAIGGATAPAARTVGDTLGAGAKLAANKLLPGEMPTKNALDMSKRVRDELGIDLKLGQVSPSNSAVGKRGITQEAATSQLRGVARIANMSYGVLSDNLSKETIDKAYKDIGSRLDAVIPQVQMVPDPAYLTGLADATAKVTGNMGIKPEYVKDVLEVINTLTPPAGTLHMAGDRVQQAIHKGGRLWDLMHSQDPSVVHIGTELYDTLMSAMERSTPVAYAQEFRLAREQYKNLVTIGDPLAAASPSGLPDVKKLASLAEKSTDDKLKLLSQAADYLANTDARGVAKGAPLRDTTITTGKVLRGMGAATGAALLANEGHNLLTHATPSYSALGLGLAAAGTAVPPIANEIAMRSIANRSAAPQSWRIPDIKTRAVTSTVLNKLLGGN